MFIDADIRRNVEAELRWNPEFRRSHIGVMVEKGVVTLIGDVDHVGVRWDAVETAKRVRGVKAVANEISIKILPDDRVCDTEIAEAVVSALRGNVTTQPFPLQAVVDHGRVRLSGRVPNAFQRASAEALVRQLKGVTAIVNEIMVTTAPGSEACAPGSAA